MLYCQAETYHQRPSSLLGLETPWGAWQLDETVMIVGRKIEKGLSDGKEITELLNTSITSDVRGTQQYSGMRSRVKRKLKISKRGTW